jgi:outer membrane lipopolysaccharide assembly protein LptE/RlpB
MIKKFCQAAFILFFLSIFISGCYWHFRSPGDVPPQLKVMALVPENIDSRFNVQLVNMLRSMRIISPPDAPMVLHAYAYSLQHNNPGVSSTNVAITYNYSLSITLRITDANGKTIVPAHRITASRDVTVNVNQIFTINSTSVFQEELRREAINLIYYWLTSDQTRRYLTRINQVKPHAIPAPTTSATP